MGTGTGRKRWLLAGPVALALLAGAGLSWWWMDRQLDQRTLQAQIAPHFLYNTLDASRKSCWATRATPAT